MIIINSKQMEAVFNHGKEGYPHEVCGIILGTCSGDTKKAVEIRKAGNLNTDRAHDRYEMDPKDLLAAEKEARELGIEVVGFYHTHPDHPDAPSEFDRQRAWPMYSYLIISVRDGKDVSIKSWQLNDETEKFEAEKILGEGE